MAPMNMPIQPVQLRQQIMAASQKYVPQKTQKMNKRYGRRPVRDGNGDQLPAGRRRRAASGAGDIEVFEDIEDVLATADLVLDDDRLEEDDAPVDAPSPKSSPTLQPQEPKQRAPSGEDFPELKQDEPTSPASGGSGSRGGRKMSAMSAGSFAEVMKSPMQKFVEPPAGDYYAALLLEELGAGGTPGVKTPKPASVAAPPKMMAKIAEEEEEDVWLTVGPKGKLAPEKKKAPEPTIAPEFEALSYDAEEFDKDSRQTVARKANWRANGDAHTGRRSWKVDPAEQGRDKEAAVLRKKVRAGKGGQVVEEEDAWEEDAGEKKRSRLDRKAENRRLAAEGSDEDAASTSTDESDAGEENKPPADRKSRAHTKRQRKQQRTTLGK